MRVRINRTFAVLATALAVTVAGLAVAPTASAERYKPRPGVVFNNPLGTVDQKWAVHNEIVRSIRGTGRKQKIRIHSWNIRSGAITRALINAHKRGVSVRVIIWVGNAHAENPNELLDELERELKRNGNRKRPQARKSGVTRCVGSCRGRGGIAHSKYFLFTRVNGVRHVIIYGGHNATRIAATHQWNDVDIITEKRPIFRDFMRTFNESYRDEPVRPAWRTNTFGRWETQFYPYQGPKISGDPVLDDLRKVKCRGSTHPATPNGRTQIRIAMTSWHGERGKNIARLITRKQDQGCDIKIIYAVAGNQVMRILRSEGNRPVPFRQIVQDFDGDGVYDRYLHTKVMTVRGVWDGRTRASMVWNGSANWSPLVIASDEAGMRMQAPAKARAYARFVDHWYDNPPVSARPNPQLMARTAAQGIDPYAKIEVD